MSEAWVTILIAGAATFSMRAAFLVFAHRLVDIPDWARRLLRQIPPAALAAIVIPAFVRPHQELSFWQPRLLAGLLATVVAFRTKNIALTLLVGMTAVLLM
jgi:branched-subunit amino acid transport protein